MSEVTTRSSESPYKEVVVHLTLKLNEQELNALIAYDQVKELKEIEAWAAGQLKDAVAERVEMYLSDLAEETEEYDEGFTEAYMNHVHFADVVSSEDDWDDDGDEWDDEED